VKVIGSTNGDFINIQIKDNGIGMEKAYIHTIFDTLTKLNNNSKFEGSGIGLATCKKIVEHLGGTIMV